MTTRSFLKSLALLSGAAAGCPGIFIPKFEPVRWKRSVYPSWDARRAMVNNLVDARKPYDEKELMTWLEFSQSPIRFTHIWRGVFEQ